MPKSIVELDVRQHNLLTTQIDKLPPNLSELLLCDQSLPLIAILPRTLRRLHLMPIIGVSVLKSDICEGVEALEILECCLHHFETVACLSIFKRLKLLELRVESKHLATEKELFSNFQKSSTETIEEVQLAIRSAFSSPWPQWLTQLEKFQKLKHLTCNSRLVVVDSADCPSALPEYFKRLPPNITHLDVPPIPRQLLCANQSSEESESLLSSHQFLDCFHHFPSSLTSLSFGKHPHTLTLKLSDDCFTHLPQNLTSLNLAVITGITNHFWDVIPPHISDFHFNSESIDIPSFHQRRMDYLHNTERLMLGK
jgi:hypothetical protein